MKSTFSEAQDRKTKELVIGLLPEDWTVQQIRSEFPGASFYMARTRNQAKSSQQGPGRRSDTETLHLVEEFYCSDDVSRPMPGKKDFISVKVDGKRQHVQKRLLLNNLKELYCRFKEINPEKEIGFSKFASLRPKHCILAGKSGTHSVCVCTIHQNVVLMMQGAKLSFLSADRENCYKSFKDCLKSAICDPPTPSCYFAQCPNCPGFSGLAEDLEKLFREHGVELVNYKCWTTTDRSNLEDKALPTDDFIEIFVEKLRILLKHSFIADQQSAYLYELKTKLNEGEFIVLCDFSENYSFVLQDEAQGYHWNNAQATVHPFVIYYRDNCHNLQHKSFVIISDSLKHDTTLFHTFQRRLITYMRENFDPINKIFYFSDGAAAHYKNRKNFINLTLHEKDFNIPAEWHFFATAHGKSACDGIGGTLKRLATKASLQRPYTGQIMTPRQLFDWAQSTIQNIDFCFVTDIENKIEAELLTERFSIARRIPGTQSLHSFQPVGENNLVTKVYSSSDTSIRHSVAASRGHVYCVPSEIQGFITFRSENSWKLGCVVSTEDSTDQIRVFVLQSVEQSSLFSFPSQPHIITISSHSVLAKVDPRKNNDGLYYLTPSDSTETLKRFSNI